jgi:hypothetical protein
MVAMTMPALTSTLPAVPVVAQDTTPAFSELFGDTILL